jgi:UDP-MurNAc hydroxylase
LNQAIELQFITHACVLLSAGPVRLLCDPWLSGTAFGDGWRLLAEPESAIVDYKPTHIWISHEHPDHFSPRDLLSIPPEARAELTVLYQETRDGKVASFLRAKGFAVQTLPAEEEVSLAADVSVRCGPMGADSWLIFSALGQNVLNLNDCITGQDILIDDPNDLPKEQLKHLAQWAFQPDVLLTQFSYSNWVGNPNDAHLHRLQAKTKLNQVRQQIRFLEPTAVLPFASYVHFCHEENSYLNAEANTVHDVNEVIESENCSSIILAPNETWTVGDSRSNIDSLNTWDSIYLKAADAPEHRSEPVSIDTLQDAFSSYQSRVREKNDWSAIQDLAVRGGLPKSSVYLWDHRMSLSFDLTTSMEVSDTSPDECDMQMGSSSLAYLLNYDWGRGTLMVNGRFSANYAGIQRFLAQTQIAYANNVGLRYPDSLTEDVIRESPSYVAFFAQQALRLNRTALSES